VIQLHKAQQLALKVVGELMTYCQKIEIAGSVRRERNQVNDIDLVLLPKPAAIPTIIARCERKMKIVTGGGENPKNVTFFGLGFQLDLFFAHGEIPDLISATPTNWGAVFLCRTGSQQHNVQLCSLARAKGFEFRPYSGLVRKHFVAGLAESEIIASETEEDIYKALGLEWRHPRERETLVTRHSSLVTSR